VTEEEFSVWESKFRSQTKVRFRREQTTADQIHEQIGLGLRSAVLADSLDDDEAYNVDTTNEKRLSRFHWEDVLRLKVGENIIVFFKNNSNRSIYIELC
jgi:hypothetical protein